MLALGPVGRVVSYVKSYFTADASAVAPGVFAPGGVAAAAWGTLKARLARYAVFTAHAENSAYDDVHRWAREYKVRNGLYRYTRGVYNPAKRLSDFWATHLMGGTLDPDAGDGRETPSCLPIVTANEPLRPAIARLWRDSEWQVQKEWLCRLGPTLGDAVARVCDEPDRGRVTLEVLHPEALEWADFDADGNVRAYRLAEQRPDPEFDYAAVSPQADLDAVRRWCTYGEYCYLDAATGLVHYRTYRNGAPYAWNGVAAEWAEPYGFVPLIVHAHAKLDPKVQFGWPELHGAHAKVRNLDDLASTLHDQIRKCVRPKWFYTGLQDPARAQGRAGAGLEVQSAARTAAPSSANPEPERQELTSIYAGIGATAYPMVFQLDIQFTSQEIQNTLADIERDYPELRFERLRATGDASAKALREARKPAEAKVHAVRAGYDATLVRLHKMALAIGGLRGYAGYEAFGGVSGLEDPALDHRIGTRSVFNADPLDIIEEEAAMLQAVATGAQSGIPAAITLERCGWDAEQLAALEAARVAEQELVIRFERQRLEVQAASQKELADHNAELQVRVQAELLRLQAEAAAAEREPEPAGAGAGA